jgi:hypothetical protein
MPSLYEGGPEGYELCLQLAYLYWFVAASNASVLVFYGSSQLFSIALFNFYGYILCFELVSSKKVFQIHSHPDLP